jgi:hypothetical protein
MAFEYAKYKLPPDVMQAAMDGLQFFDPYASSDSASQRELRAAIEGEGQVWQVFILTLPEVLKGGSGLKGASAGGWRIAAGSAPEVMAGDVYTGNTVQRRYPYPLAAGTPRLACIRKGEEISKMLSAIQLLTQPPLVAKLPSQPFDLHLLLLPGLVTEALWLQPQDPAAGTSYVVPFNTLITNLEAGTAYSEDQFIQLLQPVAQKWVNFRKQETSRASKHPETGKTVLLPLLFPRRTAPDEPPKSCATDS